MPFLDAARGCVVPPEHRPGCSGFGCDQVSLEVREQATALLIAATRCPTVQLLGATAAAVSRTILRERLLDVPVLRAACERLS